VGSVLSGGFAALLFAASALVLPAFAKMLEETGILLTPSSDFLIGMPSWTWWLLSVLSVTCMSLKDRWLTRPTRRAMNGLYLAATVGAGLWIVASLFSPLIYTIDHI
jgi:type II secretory pathway component PulF